ncbi:HSBP1 domain-containing protein [Phanerochaete sordida]|uniref:HSBP1 domain-containing protein n=1 Tax=Phanerochaete sordida TaxID=48140 RepID=A0A9P3L804_9APHY|nr:HSBP1 domain-containing protein [Phanerochaete sordida]
MPPPSSALPLNVTPAATPSRPSPVVPSASGPTAPAAAPAKPAAAGSSDISSPHELTAFVENLLEQLDAKFDDMSSQILDRMMQMSSRVDTLEASIQDIITAGDAGPAAASLPQSPTAQRKGSA